MNARESELIEESDEGGEVERKGGEREIRRAWKRITESDDDPQCEGWCLRMGWWMSAVESSYTLIGTWDTRLKA